MAKRYLDVNYDDRELAKRLGAKWDPSVRRWYCPAGSPLAKIFKWRAEARISEANATLKGAAQKAAAQDADHTGTLKLQKPRTHSDIHFKTASMMPPAARKPQLAMNQNLELFMAS